MKKILLMLTVLCCLTSCNEVLEEVSFGVTTDQNNTYEAGSKILFRFEGNPDYITFYSGEAGHRYDLDGQIDEEGTANFGVSVKSMNAREESYTHTYQTAGTYEAVFVARNVTYEGEHQQIERITLTITDPTPR